MIAPIERIAADNMLAAVTIAFTLAPLGAFKTLKKDEYGISYEKAPFKPIHAGIKPAHELHVGTITALGTNQYTNDEKLGTPIAMARGREDMDIIVGNPHFDVNSALTAPNGGFVKLYQPKGNVYKNELGMSMPKNADTDNDIEQIEKGTSYTFNTKKGAGSSTSTSCTFHIGKAVAISDDGQTFAFSCDGGSTFGSGQDGLNNAYADLTDAKHVVVVANYDTTHKVFKFTEILDSDRTGATATFGESIALSGDGKTLFIGDSGDDSVYVYHYGAPGGTECDVTNNDDKWYGECDKKAFMGYADDYSWYSTQGDKLHMDATSDNGKITAGWSVTTALSDIKDKDSQGAATTTKEAMGYALSASFDGSRLAITSRVQTVSGSGHYAQIRVWKRRSKDGWFYGSDHTVSAAWKPRLDKDDTEKQLVFSERISDSNGAGINVALSSAGDYVAFAAFDGTAISSQPVDSGVVAVCSVGDKMADKNENCQYGHGEKNDKIGTSRNGIALSDSGLIVAVGAPTYNHDHDDDEESRRRRAIRPHPVAKEEHENAGYLLMAAWNVDDDATTLRSIAYKTDTLGTENNGYAGYGVACAAECEFLVKNDHDGLSGNQGQGTGGDDKEWYETWWGITIFVVLGVAVVAVGGVAVFKAVQGPGGASMGYKPTALGESVL